MFNSPKRIAFVLNAITGDELKAGNRDVARIYDLLTDPELGDCAGSPKPHHECKGSDEFRELLLPIIKKWEPQNQLIFYFSGHGLVQRGYYCLQLGNDLLAFKSLMTELELYGVKRAIIIFDTCHSGAALDTVGIKAEESVRNIIERNEIPPGIAVLASCKASQISHEAQDGSASIFTELFYNGIKTGLDGQCTDDGFITVSDIISYISNKLNFDTRYSSFDQRPVFSINGAERDIWIAKNKSGSIPKQVQIQESSPVRSPEELKLLYEKTLPYQHPCPNATVEDIDWDLVREYSNRIHYPDLSDKENSKENILAKFQFYSPIPYEGRKILHKAAVLCFGRRPESFYPQARSVFVVGNPGDKNFIREDVKGSLRYQVERLIELARGYIEKISCIADDGLRYEREAVDFDVIRELISNAITHRDYDSYGTVKVTLTPEAFEVQNPGNFPPDTSWDIFIKSSISYSKPIDSAISLYLSSLLVFEGIGRGFDIFRKYVRKNGENSISCDELPGSITCIRVFRPKKKFLVPTEALLTRHQENLETVKPFLDYGDAPDITIFFGRTEELKILEQWILQDHCRLIAILGMRGIGKTSLSIKLGRGGIGKTELSVKLAEDVQDKFDFVIWRRLTNAPPITEILRDIIKFLSNQQETVLSENVDEQISRLLHYLKAYRCLLILDNMEAILNSGDCPGQYRNGYEKYGELLRQVGEIAHQSCLLVTSREKPIEIAKLEGKERSVRSLELGGLCDEDVKKLFQEIGSFSGSTKDWQALTEFYNGNPLALEIAAKHIAEVFFGDISTFLREGKPVFNDLYELLNWHFERCSQLEKEIMYWFAINREPVSFSELKEDVLSLPAKEQLSSTLQSLQRRIPIEKSSSNFTLQPILIEYITENLVMEISNEIKANRIDTINKYPLIKATSKEYVRESQIRLILQPIINNLINTMGEQWRLEKQLHQILSVLQERSSINPGYAGGNILNILSHLKIDLNDYDFSNLSIWQAYLSGINLHNANFAYSDLSKCIFYYNFSDVCSIIFSPDGKFLATGDIDGYIRLWNRDSYQLLSIIYGHADKIRSVAFSPEGKLIASGSDDKTVKIWDVNTGECLKTLQGHTDRVQAVCFNPDGKTLISGSDDKTIRKWNVFTGEYLSILTEHTDNVRSVAFSQDGQIIASSSDDKTVKVWENTNQSSKTFQGHIDKVTSIAFSQDGQMIASGSDDKTIKIWDIHNNQCLKTLYGHTDSIQSIAFSFSGSLLASGSEDHTIKIWDVITEKCLKTLAGHTDSVHSVVFSPDSDVIASSSKDETIRFWDVVSGFCIRILMGFGASRIPKPYEGMNIIGVTGLTEAQKTTLKALGAIEK